MLRCSKCGTINADGNLICNNCGKKFDRTTIKCPECGTLNTVGNIFCDNCQTQIVSPDEVIPPEEEDITITPVKGISLPTRADSDEEADIPEWLQQLTDDVQTNIGEEVPEENNVDFSDDDQADMELPSWLLSDSDDITQKDLPSQPDITPELDVQDVPESTQTEETPTAGIPDWLSAIADEIDAAASSPSGAPDIPEWLSSIAEDSGTASDPETDQPLPGLIKPEFESESAGMPTDDAQPVIEFDEKIAVETDSETLEISLTSEPDVSSEYTEQDTQLQSFLEKTEPELLPSDSDAPEVPGSEIPLPVQTMHIDQTENDINLTPDWLSIPVVDVKTEDVQEDEEDTETDEEIPDWLSELGERTFEAEKTSTPKLSAEKVMDNQDLPSWLSEINVQQDATEDSQSVFTPESAEALAPETQQPETPAWLDEVSTPSETISIRPAAPAFIPSEVEVEQKAEEGDLDLGEVEDESFPSWLNELRLPEPGDASSDTPASVGFGVPAGEFLGSLDETLPGDTEGLARAEVPEWLHDLKPPAGGPWPPLATVPSAEALDLEEITPADVPDWVRALRPEPGEQREKAPEQILPLEPAEIEGPLSSLAGILPTSTVIDMPADFKVDLVKIPDNVIKQARLWQQLLGQPRSGARKVAQRGAFTDRSSKIMRIMVTIIFVFGSIAALWLLPPNNLTSVSSTGNTPGTTKFVDSVDMLQPGETVIVAVEYGWAQADEMTSIANVVLNHLLDQKVNVIAVSTMPEGTAIIPYLLESHELSNMVSGNALYLSNSASGIAGFLNEPNAQSASMLIILSSHYERIRWWIEQNHIAASAAGNSALIVNAGLSASVGPLTAPYLNEFNTHGWLIGFQDSLSYQALRGLQDAEQTRILNVLLVMHWSAVILLIIGFLYTLVSGEKRVS